MKKNKILLLSLLALALVVTGCKKEKTQVNRGSDAIADIGGSNTNKTLQNLYEELKATSGGSMALDILTKKIASIEYASILQCKEIWRFRNQSLSY